LVLGVLALIAAHLGAPCARAGQPDIAPARPTSEPAAADRIERLILELSDDAYTVRQSAARQLLAVGMPAREPLLAVVDGPDPETRAAARRLIALIDKSEFNRRLEAFAADSDGSEELSLPGWKQFQDLVGGDAAARALFVDMQRHEAALLASVFNANGDPQEAFWEERLLRLLQWQVTANSRPTAPPVGSCATMFFLGSVAEGGVSDRSAMYLAQLVQRPPVAQSMPADRGDDPVRRLVIAWVVKCPNQSEAVLQQRLNLALVHKLAEAIPLAFGVAQSDPDFLTTQPATRAVAILAVGQLGKPDDAVKLEPLLDDATVCLPLQAAKPADQASSVQIRDVALMAMLHLTGQKPADYGYVHARQQPQQLFDLRTLFVENDAQREAAAAKWREWKAAQPKDEQR
jgi:hypothetical protein